jgi:hypothetical protein
VSVSVFVSVSVSVSVSVCVCVHVSVRVNVSVLVFVFIFVGVYAYDECIRRVSPGDDMPAPSSATPSSSAAAPALDEEEHGLQLSPRPEPNMSTHRGVAGPLGSLFGEVGVATKKLLQARLYPHRNASSTTDSLVTHM